MTSEQPKEYIITEGMIQILLDWLSYRRYNDCDVDTWVEQIRSRPHPAPRPPCEECMYQERIDKAAKAAREQVLNVRPEVRRFAELMEAKLKKNDHKSHGSKESFTYLFGRLDDERKELNQAVSSAKTNNGRIADEAVDVANFLMMIVDNLESLRARPAGGK